jgi:hypothetical protein
MLLETGQPMSQFDQFIADEEWPEIRLQILQIDNGLSVAHENYLLMTVAKHEFTEATQANIKKWEPVYQKWCQLATATDGFDCQFPTEVKQAVEDFLPIMQWDEPAFQFE